MSVKSIRLANILFEDEKKYAEKVNEALLVEAVEDVQGYIEDLSALKTGLVGHPEVVKVIDNLHDKLMETVDESSSRIQRIIGKRTKLATAASDLTKNLFDLYKKISLSSAVKPQFEVSKQKLQLNQLALKVTIDAAAKTQQPPVPAGPPAPPAEPAPGASEAGGTEPAASGAEQAEPAPPVAAPAEPAPPVAAPAEPEAGGEGAAGKDEKNTEDTEDVVTARPGAATATATPPTVAERRSKLRKLIIKEMYSLSLQNLFEEERSATSTPASPATPPSDTMTKLFVKFVDLDPNNIDDSEVVAPDLMIAHKASDKPNVARDFSSLGIGIDEVEMPGDITDVYIVGFDSDNKPAALPERFSSNIKTRAPDKTLGVLNFDKIQPAIKNSVALINKSLKKAGVAELSDEVFKKPGEFFNLKMLQFTSNFKLFEKAMSTPPGSSASGALGNIATAAGAAAVGAAIAGGGGSSGGGGAPGGAGPGSGGAATPRIRAHSLKNAIGGLITKDGKQKLEDVINIVPVKDTINNLLGTEFFRESVSYDQDRWELLAGIGRKN